MTFRKWFSLGLVAGVLISLLLVQTITLASNSFASVVVTPDCKGVCYAYEQLPPAVEVGNALGINPKLIRVINDNGITTIEITGTKASDVPITTLDSMFASKGKQRIAVFGAATP